MRRFWIIALLIAFLTPWVAVSSAQASGITLRAAEREMKKDKNYEAGDLYTRAHRLIYGDKAPMGPDGRVRIAVVLAGDEWVMVEDRVKNQIYKKLREKFPREDFALMKGTDVNTYLLTRAEDIYAEERNKAVGNYPKDLSRDVDGIKVNDGGYGAWNSLNVPQTAANRWDKENQPRGFADIRLQDYVDAGKKYNYDYVFALNMTLGGSTEEFHDLILFHSVTRKQNVLLRVRFVDTKNEEYLYRRDMPVRGESHNSGFNGRLFEKSVQNGMTEILNDIEIDKD